MKAHGLLVTLLAIGAGSLALSCAHGVGLETLEARTLRATLAPEKGAPATMRATYFPSTAPRGRKRGVPLVVVEPILFRRELLYASAACDGGLVRYLEGEGFSIWLVGAEASSPPDPRTFAGGIAKTVAAIARETGTTRVDLLGLSLGAEAALRALEQLTAPGAPVTIGRVAFLGGGFDFAYPHSFATRTAAIRGGPAAALCTLDGDVNCARDFHAPSAADPWLGSIPTADSDALSPSRERFSFVSRFTRLPVLFVNGKADGIAPSESMFPLYTLWGSDEPDSRTVPKLMFLAGRENALGFDFDQFDLFGGDRAEKVWSHVAAWLARAN